MDIVELPDAGRTMVHGSGDAMHSGVSDALPLFRISHVLGLLWIYHKREDEIRLNQILLAEGSQVSVQMGESQGSRQRIRTC